ILYSMAFNALGLIFIGGDLPSFKEMAAPISANGPETRAIGLMAMELSPRIVALMPRPESSPIRRRVDLTELPVYRAWTGVLQSSAPGDVTVMRPASFVMLTPRCDMISDVLKVSSLSSGDLIVEVPSARAAIISARCVIDLSPGSFILPINL